MRLLQNTWEIRVQDKKHWKHKSGYKARERPRIPATSECHSHSRVCRALTHQRGAESTLVLGVMLESQSQQPQAKGKVLPPRHWHASHADPGKPFATGWMYQRRAPAGAGAPSPHTAWCSAGLRARAARQNRCGSFAHLGFCPQASARCWGLHSAPGWHSPPHSMPCLAQPPKLPQQPTSSSLAHDLTLTPSDPGI